MADILDELRHAGAVGSATADNGNYYASVTLDQLYQVIREIVHLRKVRNDALRRMDLARGILTDNNPRKDCNWGMLDTSDLRYGESK